MTFVTVGDPRNPDEDGFLVAGDKDVQNEGIGYVGQTFQIAETEVTNAMYAQFLNAVAKDDRLYGLYTTLMATDPLGGILRSGANGSYVYTVIPGFEDKPVNFVTAFDAMRFCNWLHNGMPSGGQTLATTEDGAYTLRGANNNQVIRRNAGARFYLPDVDEWHKAAYYDPDPGNGRPSESYWPFADQSTTGPGGNVAPPGPIGSSRTPLPVKTSSGPSHYGTYDQDGNVSEWTDSAIAGTDGSISRLLAGAGPQPMLQKQRSYLATEEKKMLYETSQIGFRVAKPAAQPGPGGVPLVKPVLVRVIDPVNPADSTVKDPDKRRPGAVNYIYQVGVYEVTNDEYVKFLNAAAREDLFYGLYDTRMQTDPLGGIRRTGLPGNFSYQTVAGRESWPVNFVGVFDAMRYCNWLHNGATVGADTEAGAYRLLGNIPPNSISLIRNPVARYFLPSSDEWHKAAFYEPEPAGKPSASYWKFATRSDAADSSIVNFGKAYGGLTSVSFLRSSSYYGALGQSGNVAEIVETAFGGSDRVARGGAWDSANADVSSESFKPIDGFKENTDGTAGVGFRVAAAADIESGVLPPGPPPPPPPPKGTKQQTITFKQLPKNKKVGSIAFKITPKSSSRLPVVCESSDSSVAIVSSGRRFTYVLIRGAGTATITAKQEGDTVWAAAEPVARQLIIAPRASRIR